MLYRLPPGVAYRRLNSVDLLFSFECCLQLYRCPGILPLPFLPLLSTLALAIFFWMLCVSARNLLIITAVSFNLLFSFECCPHRDCFSAMALRRPRLAIFFWMLFQLPKQPYWNFYCYYLAIFFWMLYHMVLVELLSKGVELAIFFWMLYPALHEARQPYAWRILLFSFECCKSFWGF